MTIPGEARAAIRAGLALFFLTASAARAETCPAMAGAEPGLATLPAETRIAFIRARLDAERPRAQTWRRSFTIALALNAAFGLAIGLRDSRWNGAAIMFAMGEIIGETQILTQPIGLVSDLARYRAGDVGGALASRPRLAWAVAPVAAPEGTGLAVFLAF